MIRLVLFFLLLQPLLASSQFAEVMPGRGDYEKPFGSVSSGYFIDSRHVTNRFLNTYRRSGFIGRDLKDQVSNKLDDKNTLGGSFDFDASFRSGLDSVKKWGWFVGLSHQGILDARFSRDLFRVYFYGNKDFAGKSADLSHLQYRQVQYQQLRAGLYRWTEKKDVRSLFAAGAGYVNGQDFVEIKTGSSGLFTAQDGTYIKVDLSLEAQHADSANHSLGSFNGSGAAFYLYYQYEKINRYRFSIEVKDAGFIAWNKQTTHLTVDTNYYFDGVQVNNILDSLYLEVKSVEDYKNGFIKEDKRGQNTLLLPALITASVEKWFLQNRFLTGIHVQYRINTLQIPVVEWRGTWSNNRNLYAGVQLRYGGYSQFHAGLRFGYLPVRKIMLEAGSSYLDGYLFSRTRSGQGMYIRIGILL